LLLDSNFGAAYGLACKEANLALDKLDDTIAVGVDCEVAADAGTNTWALRHTNLADDNLTDFNFLATIDFNTKTLTRTVMDVLYATTSFYV
jgi:hypothetical protein